MPDDRLRDALGELGLETGATKGEIRKAYLRLVKTRPPETDPEGFQRLREAYDRLVAAVDVAGSVEVSAPDARTPGEGASAAPSAQDAPRPAPRDGALVAAIAAHAGKDWRAASRLLQRELAGADREARSIALPPEDIVTWILRMRVAGAHTDARNVTRALDAHATAAGGDTRLFGEAYLPWLVARELVDLGGELPSTVKGSLALAALEGDIEAARPGLEEAGGKLADATRRVLERSPVFAKLFAPMLAESPSTRPQPWASARARELDGSEDAPRPRPRRVRPWLWLIPGVAGVMALVRALQAPPEPQLRSVPMPMQKAPRTYDSATARVVDGMLDEVEATAHEAKPSPQACRQAGRMLETIDRSILDEATLARLHAISDALAAKCP